MMGSIFEYANVVSISRRYSHVQKSPRYHWHRGVKYVLWKSFFLQSKEAVSQHFLYCFSQNPEKNLQIPGSTLLTTPRYTRSTTSQIKNPTACLELIEGEGEVGVGR